MGGIVVRLTLGFDAARRAGPRPAAERSPCRRPLRRAWRMIPAEAPRPRPRAANCFWSAAKAAWNASKPWGDYRGEAMTICEGMAKGATTLA